MPNNLSPIPIKALISEINVYTAYNQKTNTVGFSVLLTTIERRISLTKNIDFTFNLFYSDNSTML